MVVAVEAQRLAQPRIVGVVAGEARYGLPVRAGSGVAAGAAGCGSAVAALPGAAGVARDVAVVDRAEGRGGEGGEDDRVPADRGGDALAAGQSATDNLVGVALVDPGAVRAHRLAAVTARLVQRPVGQLVGVLLAQDSAGVAVDGGDGAAEADRASTAAGGAGVLQPAGELRRSGAMQDLGVTTGGEAGAVGGEDGCLLLRGWQGRETKHHQPVDACPLVVFVVSPGTAERAANAGGRNRGDATSRRWVMSFHARGFGIEAGTGGEAGMSASGGLPQAAPTRGDQRIRAIVDGMQRPSWAA